MVISWFDVASYVLAVLATTALIGFYSSAFSKQMPSAPAALGRALGFLFLFQGVGSVLLWYVISNVSAIFRFEHADVLVLWFRFLSFSAASLMSGILAVRTYEDVRGMNAKIFLVIGLFVNSVMSLFAFIETWMLPYALASFIPAALLGIYIGGRLPHNHSLKLDGPDAPPT